MGIGDDFRTSLLERIVPPLYELERSVRHHGYLRTFSGMITLIGVFGALGSVFGATWLRIIFVTFTGCAVLLLLTLLMAALSATYHRHRHTEALLHRYARATLRESPLKVYSWDQDTVIERNGDALINIEITFEADIGEGPRAFEVYLNYYGETEMTARARKRVHCQTWRAATTKKQSRTRADTTHTWMTTRSGRPKLEVLAHFENAISQGETITIQVYWPAYSADLVNGRQPENFDILINSHIETFNSLVTFRGTAENHKFTVRNEGVANLQEIRRHGDTLSKFQSRVHNSEKYWRSQRTSTPTVDPNGAVSGNAS